MATQKDSKSENLKKIQVLEPPQIDVRTEPKLVGTNGISAVQSTLGNILATVMYEEKDYN